MPSIIDFETMAADELPSIWSPYIPPDLSESDRLAELDRQSAANLIFNSDVPEAVLRLLLNECDVEPAYEPPKGYDPDEQGEWDADIFSLVFTRPIRLEHIQRKPDRLIVIYDFGSRGHWRLEIEAERVVIERV